MKECTDRKTDHGTQNRAKRSGNLFDQTENRGQKARDSRSDQGTEQCKRRNRNERSNHFVHQCSDHRTEQQTRHSKFDPLDQRSQNRISDLAQRIADRSENSRIFQHIERGHDQSTRQRTDHGSDGTKEIRKDFRIDPCAERSQKSGVSHRVKRRQDLCKTDRAKDSADRRDDPAPDQSTVKCIDQRSVRRAKQSAKQRIGKTFCSSASQGVCQSAEFFSERRKKSSADKSTLQCSLPLSDQLAKQIACQGVDDRTKKRSGNDMCRAICCPTEQKSNHCIDDSAEGIAKGCKR